MTAEPSQGVGWLTDTREETVELANEKRGSADEMSRGEAPEEGSVSRRPRTGSTQPQRRGRVEPVGETPRGRGSYQGQSLVVPSPALGECRQKLEAW